MSDREGNSGGGAPPDEDLSLPKATVAKMISGMCFVQTCSPKHAPLNLFAIVFYRASPK